MQKKHEMFQIASFSTDFYKIKFIIEKIVLAAINLQFLRLFSQKYHIFVFQAGFTLIIRNGRKSDKSAISG